MGTVGRLFVGVDLQSDTRQALAGLLSDGIAEPLPGKVVRPENWHLTLRFLGDVESVTYDRLLNEVSGADLGAPFEVVFEELGAFPRKASATVLWIGIGEGSAPLLRLAGAVETAVCNAGLAEEDRPFRGHLTLSRIRPPQNVSRLIAVSEHIRVRAPVDEVTLFRSHLGDGVVRYEVLERFEL